MCVTGQPRVSAASPAVVPSSAADAVAMAQAALGWLASADAAALTVAEQADCLRALERIESVQTRRASFSPGRVQLMRRARR